MYLLLLTLFSSIYTLENFVSASKCQPNFAAETVTKASYGPVILRKTGGQVKLRLFKGFACRRNWSSSLLLLRQRGLPLSFAFLSLASPDTSCSFWSPGKLNPSATLEKGKKQATGLVLCCFSKVNRFLCSNCTSLLACGEREACEVREKGAGPSLYRRVYMGVGREEYINLALVVS